MTRARTIPSRDQLIAELNAATDKAKTLLDGHARVERVDPLHIEITTTGQAADRWKIGHNGGGWDVFEVGGLADLHIDTFKTAMEAVTYVVELFGGEEAEEE